MNYRGNTDHGVVLHDSFLTLTEHLNKTVYMYIAYAILPTPLTPSVLHSNIYVPAVPGVDMTVTVMFCDNDPCSSLTFNE